MNDVDMDAAMLDPGGHFKTPEDVLLEKGWTPEQKFKVLRQWKYDLGQLDVATEENMSSGGPQRRQTVNMAAINAALETLGYTPDGDPLPTKGA